MVPRFITVFRFTVEDTGAASPNGSMTQPPPLHSLRLFPSSRAEGEDFPVRNLRRRVGADRCAVSRGDPARCRAGASRQRVCRLSCAPHPSPTAFAWTSASISSAR
jgi:hypothetical protein